MLLENHKVHLGKEIPPLEITLSVITIGFISGVVRIAREARRFLGRGQPSEIFEPFVSRGG